MRELARRGPEEPPSSGQLHGGSEEDSSEEDSYDDDSPLVVQPPAGGLQLARPDAPTSVASSDEGSSSDSFGEEAAETLRVLRASQTEAQQPPPAGGPQHAPARRRLEPALEQQAVSSGGGGTSDGASSPASSSDDSADSFVGALGQSRGWQAETPPSGHGPPETPPGAEADLGSDESEEGEEEEDEYDDEEEDEEASEEERQPTAQDERQRQEAATAAAKRGAESAHRAGIMGSRAGIGLSMAEQVAARARSLQSGTPGAASSGTPSAVAPSAVGAPALRGEVEAEEGESEGESEASSFGVSVQAPPPTTAVAAERRASVGPAPPPQPAAGGTSPSGTSSEDSFEEELLRESRGMGERSAESESEEGSEESMAPIAEGSQEGEEASDSEEDEDEEDDYDDDEEGEEEASGSSEPDADEPRLTAGDSSEPTYTSYTDLSAGELEPPGELPAPWAEVEADDGRVYYWNEETEEVTWTRPVPPKPKVAPPPRETRLGKMPQPPKRTGPGLAPPSFHPHLGRRSSSEEALARAPAPAPAPARDPATAAAPSAMRGRDPVSMAALEAVLSGQAQADGDEEEDEEGVGAWRPDTSSRASLSEADAAAQTGALAAAQRKTVSAERAGIMGAGAGIGAGIAAEVAAMARGGAVRKGRSVVQENEKKAAAPAPALLTTPEMKERRSTDGAVLQKAAAVMSAEKASRERRRSASDESAPLGGASPTKTGRRARTESMEASLKHRRDSGLSAQAMLTEQQRHLKQERKRLELEQEAHADRVARLEAREAKVRAAEGTLGTRQQELEAWHEQLGEYETEQHWEHWRRDGMRSLMLELVRKVPRDEWKVRMQRALTQLELLKRENLRLRQELAAARSGSPTRGALSSQGTPGAAAASPTRGSGGALTPGRVPRTPGGTPVELEGFGSVSEELLAQNAALQEAAARAEDELRRSRKLEASREGYLNVLQRDASESQSRNEAQQRRLEVLTAENSKLKKETTRLRGEVSSSRMDEYEKELMQTELQGAKDSALAMQAQLERMHQENTALRDGEGLRRELAQTREQLAAVEEQKANLDQTLHGRLQHANVDSKTTLAALVDAEADAEGHYVEAMRRAAEGLRQQRRANQGTLLVRLWTQLRPAQKHAAMVWALSTWHSAARFAETGALFGELRERVGTLAAASAQLAGEVEVLQLSESGGLQLRHLSLLHDNWKDVLLGELRAAEAEAEEAKRQLAASGRKLLKREDDLVLMIERYEGATAAQRELTARVAAASDGSALHLARLHAEKAELSAQAERAAAELAQTTARAAEAREMLALRERQLAVMLAQLDASKAEATEARKRGGGEAAQLRAALAKRQRELVALVRELYKLAAAEKDASTVDYAARSRLFSQSASIYQSLGAEAFAEDTENAAPPAAPREAGGRLALPQPSSQPRPGTGAQ